MIGGQNAYGSASRPLPGPSPKDGGLTLDALRGMERGAQASTPRVDPCFRDRRARQRAEESRAIVARATLVACTSTAWVTRWTAGR